MESLFEKFSVFISDLNKNENIYVEKKESQIDALQLIEDEELLTALEDGLALFTESVEKSSGIIISNKDKHIFHLSGLSFCWTFTNKENEFFYGGFELAGMDNALANESVFWKTDFSLPPDVEVPKHLLEYKKLNWFEKQAWGDDLRYGCFYRKAGAFPPPIYFYDQGAFFPFPLNFEEYFDAMIASCAIRGWQYFYLESSEFNRIPEFKLKEVQLNKILKEMRESINILPKLFPEKDFSYHQNSYEKIDKLIKQ
jgi:hypothetical protein